MDKASGFFLTIPDRFLQEDAVRQLTVCNQITEKYGLSLTETEARELVETRNYILSELGRIEFGGGLLAKLVVIFRNSPYLYKQNYTQTLHELVELFYYFKNEFLDQISDDDLLLCMKECFDTRCEGSIELLQGREMERLARHIRYGMDYRSRSESYFRDIYQDEDEDEDEDEEDENDE